jgi:hypothetical protein
MAVPTFTAAASLAAPGSIRRPFGTARANDIGKSCDDQLLSDCITQATEDCREFTGAAGAGCRQRLFADCRNELGCPDGARCSPGSGGSICCPLTQTNCGGTCRNLASDQQNCGSCGIGCPQGQVCCSGICRNAAVDPANCGSCGTVCPGNAACINGVCTCPSGTTSCSGRCTDLSTDSANCGKCGASCGTAMCIGGTCGPKPCDDQLLSDCIAQATEDCREFTGAAGAGCRQRLFADCRNELGCPDGARCSPGSGGSICCPLTQTNCGGTCRNLASDQQNCGSCGVACTPGQLCCSGACSNPATDTNNCGGCGIVCTGGKSCQAGTCVCPPGRTDCSGTCRNLASDAQNCGSCGTACTGGKLCQDGVCVCPQGRADCSGTCRNLASDAQNCGSCGTACTGGKLCQDGVCVCPQGLTDCGGICRNLASDPAACGSCDISCMTGFGCCGGVCKDIAKDAENCGSSCTVCPQSCSGERRCNNGSCVNPVPITVYVEDGSSCVVGVRTVAAFTQSEATSCVQQQFPALKVGVPTTTFPYTAQVWCTGYACRDISASSLSQSDWVSCAQFQNQGCTVSAGPCQNCPVGRTNCRGACVDTSTDVNNCSSCDLACPTGATCCNGRCCPSGRVCCGGECCEAGGSCCGNQCCTSGRVCCGGKSCCAPGSTCCTDAQGGCCRSGQTCCPFNTCCSSSTEKCCPDGGCCPLNTTCCGEYCCPSNEVCTADQQGNLYCRRP